MPEPTLANTVVYALLPLVAGIIGAIIAAVRPPGPVARSYIQHLAAGVVISVVAVELLPEVVSKHQPLAVIVGFSAGVLTMLGIKYVAERSLSKQGEGAENPAAMLWAIAVDVLLDGMLIGVSFAEGADAGRLLTFALTIEMLSLSLAVSATLCRQEMPKPKVVLVTTGLMSLIVLGAVAGYLVLSAMPPVGMEIVLSFGLAALLYLVTEELLVEAHEEGDTPLATATLFAGFLLFLVIGMV